MGLVGPGGSPLARSPSVPDVDIMQAMPITIMVYPTVPPAGLVTIAHWPPHADLGVVKLALTRSLELVDRLQQRAAEAQQNGQVSEPPV